MRALASPSARRLLMLSILARLPLAMLSIGLMVHVQRLSGSFAQAGAVTGMYALALAVGGPLLGRLVDGQGQTAVLVISAGVAAVLLCAIAVVPARTPLAVLIVLAAGIGLAEPPVGACLRAQLPSLLADPGVVRAAFAFEASALELTWVAGPPLVLGAGILWSTGAALAAGGLLLLVATCAFAAQPASRGRRPAAASSGRPGKGLSTPAMRTLTVVLLLVGVLLGGDEVAVTAASKALGGMTATVGLLTAWGFGSLGGGLLLARWDGGARANEGVRASGRLLLVLGFLALGHLLLIPAAWGGIASLGAALLLAGAAISPAEASIYAVVDDAALAGTTTEAFAWLASAMALGGAIGAAASGTLIDAAGQAAAFGFAGGSGLAAVAVTAARSRTLPAPPALPRLSRSLSGSRA